MSNVAIRAEELGKEYRIGGMQESYRTLRDSLIASMSAPFKRARDLLRGQAYGAAGLEESIWALRDVSFEVKHGEVVGIIGHNGAGKSTLLKVLSRITEPTKGYVDVYGRVGALLEVGTGFHPELTGRENVYLNGAILGMTRGEIDQKFDEIVAFAEVERFIDTPVKHYSSGMGLRLGFAVAAYLEPEILVVDEVLAVGDISFQKKCLGKMGDVASEGRTVLFVSHNMSAVQALCERAIWIDRGSIKADGKVAEIVSNYVSEGVSTVSDHVWDDLDDAPGNDVIRLQRVRVYPQDSSPGAPLTVRTPFVLEFTYWNRQPDLQLSLTIKLENEQGVHVFSSASLYEPTWHGRPFPTGSFQSTCVVPGDLLNDGYYKVTLMFVQDVRYGVFAFPNILAFHVADSDELRGGWHGKWPGVVRPALDWSTEQLESGQA